MEKLKKYLEDTKINQHDFAFLLGVSESIISYYLNGKRRPGRDMALRISQLTGIPVLELLYPKEETDAPLNRF
jgi:transcriptional regulator with XRE-family HTH domain